MEDTPPGFDWLPVRSVRSNNEGGEVSGIIVAGFVGIESKSKDVPIAAGQPCLDTVQAEMKDLLGKETCLRGLFKVLNTQSLLL